jgi:hypothetical protein
VTTLILDLLVLYLDFARNSDYVYSGNSSLNARISSTILLRWWNISPLQISQVHLRRYTLVVGHTMSLIHRFEDRISSRLSNAGSQRIRR